MNIELRHLRYFLVVAEELLSVSGGPSGYCATAAEPMIQRLEHELGVSLFHRTKREFFD
jgi:DNA-binding transcriptional LysR family regulator